MLEVPHLLLYRLVTIYNSSWFILFEKEETHKQQAWRVRQKRKDLLHAIEVASHCLQTCLKRC